MSLWRIIAADSRGLQSAAVSTLRDARNNRRSSARHSHGRRRRLFLAVCRGRAKTDILLPRANGGPWGASHQVRPMHETCKRARINPPVGFHALRHTWASLSLMGGTPMMVVAENLGHADTRMVEKHYGHLLKSSRKNKSVPVPRNSESNLSPISRILPMPSKFTLESESKCAKS